MLGSDGRGFRERRTSERFGAVGSGSVRDLAGIHVAIGGDRLVRARPGILTTELVLEGSTSISSPEEKMTRMP